MKNILITGGGGFIGKNLIQELLKDNSINKIIIVDNFVTSSEADFIKFLFKNKWPNKDEKLVFYKYDIISLKPNNLSLTKFLTFLDNNDVKSIDEIYHLASLASPPFYKKFPMETLDVGYIGTKNMLELARKFKSKVLFASTSEVYGDALIYPQHENYYGNVNCFGERSSYDISKRIGETLCYTYKQLYNTDVKIPRIFNTYGPHMLLTDGRIITEVIRHLKNNTILTIYGDGNQTRSICYVLNTVQMLIKLMESDCNSPVNIGNNEELTINEIVNTIEEVWNDINNTNIKVQKQYVPLTQNDPLKRQPCLDLNKKVLGEQEYISIKDGIRKCIEYYLHNS
jgi:nucleoside-diphosphate-sugar epimerase